MNINNPILPGFNPDPAICRNGDDFYIATSTFEWFPGVQIHHSKDLVNWRLVSRPLDRVSQLNMAGVDNSGGVWAPCITYCDGLFWLIYSNVHTLNGPYKDSPNYLVTAPNIEGPWSEPIYMNGSGFDPSLFHDDDGRKWFVNQRWDHRQGRNRFDGIVLQEYDHHQQKLIGPITNIWAGELGCTEGPHLLKKDGWYYLICAEGGTSYEHAISVARSRQIEGPYENHPQNPILTAVHSPALPIQKTGHGGFIECPDGSWYTTHLCARPLTERGRCILGRETGIQRMVWDDDGWPRLAHRGTDGLAINAPQREVVAPDLPAHPWPEEAATCDFTQGIPKCFQALRIPITSDWAWTEGDELVLAGRESLYSRFYQSLLGRRITEHHAEFTARVRMQPEDDQHAAGITAFYDIKKWFYLRLTRDYDDQIRIGIEVMDEDNYSEPITVDVDEPDVWFKMKISNGVLHCFYSINGQDYLRIGEEFDASILSDEYGQGFGFTGAFFTLCCQDLSGRKLPARFSEVSYTSERV